MEKVTHEYRLPCDLVADILRGEHKVDSLVSLQAQVKSCRSRFIDVKDASGSAGEFIQVVVDFKTTAVSHDLGSTDTKFILGKLTPGMFIDVQGTLKQYYKRDDKDKKTPIWEIHASKIIVFGAVTDGFLPLAKNLSLNHFSGPSTYLRAHFEPYRAIWSIRNTMEKAIHMYMTQFRYKKLDPNIATEADCEGAGERFILQSSAKKKRQYLPITKSLIYIFSLLALFLVFTFSVCRIMGVMFEVFLAIASFATVFGLICAIITIGYALIDRFRKRPEETEWSQTAFFGKQVGLTVSSQLPLENMIGAAIGVYTMNKSFRAEESQTSRHQAEFTHLEWESRFIRTMVQLTGFSGSLFRFVIRYVLCHEMSNLEYLQRHYEATGSKTRDGGIEGHVDFISKLKFLAECDYPSITYTECIQIVKRDEDKIRSLYKLDGDKIPMWGDDLKAACERYICEHIFGGRPTFITDMPAILKSFYMLQNGDGTVQACDFIVPGIGEMIGSSIREYRLDNLLKVMKQRKMDIAPLSAYCALRRDATCPHGGAGLGFDRFVQLCTGTTNIQGI
jgi:aspartyl/asparaginyl-tRNA synthetase